jgi:hypothetical protein
VNPEGPWPGAAGTGQNALVPDPSFPYNPGIRSVCPDAGNPKQEE